MSTVDHPLDGTDFTCFQTPVLTVSTRSLSSWLGSVSSWLGSASSLLARLGLSPPLPVLSASGVSVPVHMPLPGRALLVSRRVVLWPDAECGWSFSTSGSRDSFTPHSWGVLGGPRVPVGTSAAVRPVASGAPGRSSRRRSVVHRTLLPHAVRPLPLRDVSCGGPTPYKTLQGLPFLLVSASLSRILHQPVVVLDPTPVHSRVGHMFKGQCPVVVPETPDSYVYRVACPTAPVPPPYLPTRVPPRDLDVPLSGLRHGPVSLTTGQGRDRPASLATGQLRLPTGPDRPRR